MLKKDNNEFKTSAAISAHELRTPISQIMAIAQVLKEDAKSKFLSNEERTAFLDDILLSTTSIDMLTEELLRLATGQQVDNWAVTLTEVNLRQLLSHVHHAFNAQIPKTLDFALHYNESLPDIVMGDGQRIQQCVSNLIRNAIKFTDKGKIEIIVDYANTENRLKISVSDTGIGIDKDKLKSSWEEFTKVHDVDTETNQAQKEGLGLGLNIVKHFVLAMDGTVGVTSQLGQGTTFHFTLPIK